MSHFAKSSTKAVIIIPITKDKLKSWCKRQKKAIQNWVISSEFTALPGKSCLIPDLNGALQKVLIGVSSSTNMWDCGNLSKELPKGIYKFDHSRREDVEKWALGWVLGSYHFDKYQKIKSTQRAKIFLPNSSILESTIEAIFLTRDLINTPAEDMGPAHLASAAGALAKKHKAKINIILGENLLKNNYPAIHAVGRAIKAPKQAPRLIDFKWGKLNHPKLTIIGKRSARSIVKEIKLDGGVIRAIVSKQKQSDFIIRTSVSVASVKGTDFWVISNKSNDSLIGLDGIVEFSNITSGQLLEITSGKTGISSVSGDLQSFKTDPKSIPDDPSDNSKGEQKLEIEFEDASGSKKTLVIKYK